LANKETTGCQKADGRERPHGVEPGRPAIIAETEASEWPVPGAASGYTRPKAGNRHLNVIATYRPFAV